VATEMVHESVLGNFTSLPDDEVTRALSFVVLSNSAPWLFAAGPAFRIDGAAIFTLAPGRSGAASVTVALKNDRQVLDDRRSVVVPFRVEQVNSPPTATVPAHLAVVEQEAVVEQHLVGVIHDVLPGPFYDEWNSQAVSFRVSFASSSAALFATPPFVVMEEGSGHVHTHDDIPHLPPHTLRFTTSPGVHGVAEVSLVPYDNGGVALGGSDTGQTLTTQLKVYPRPRVRAVYPRIGTVWGGATVTVRGDFFGSAYSRGYFLEAGGKYSNVSVLLGGRACEHVDVISDSELHCVVPPGRGCANISVTIVDGSLTRSGHLSCGYVYTEMLFGAVQEEGNGVLALGPKDGEAAGASALFDLAVSKSVLALHILEGGSQVVLGGSFLTAGDVRVNHIARYDGHMVHKLGNGMDGAVHALVQLPGGDMLAAGVFTKSYLSSGGAVGTGGLARWDGSRWSSLECTMSGSYFTAAVNGSLLYVGGRLKETCGIPTRGIALWDSYRWRALGSGLAGGAVHAIALHHDFVYAGGSFVEAGGHAVSRVARWDGADWHALGFLNGDVHSLAVFGEYLFAGGDFTMAGSRQCNHLARFYSGEWVEVGASGGVNGPVLTLLPIQSCLYFGGAFSQVAQAPDRAQAHSSGALRGGNRTHSSKPTTMARLARWCVHEQQFEAIQGVGMLLGSVRALAAPPLNGQCPSTMSVC